MDLHVEGNGRIVAFSEGADLTRLAGPPYTSGGLIETRWSVGVGDCAASEPAADSATDTTRRLGSPLWQHVFTRDGGGEARVDTLMAADDDVYSIRISTDIPLTLHIRAAEGARLSLVDDEVIVTSDRTAAALFYPVAVESWLVARAFGAAAVRADPRGGVRLTFEPGSSELALCLVRSCADADSAAHIRWAHHETVTLAAFRRDLDAVAISDAVRGRLPAGVLEAVLQLVLAHQSADGGHMAGHKYPLAYVRDQFGVQRLLLMLGLFDRAEAAIDYRFEKWQALGGVANAESLGHDRVRHHHENDDSEGPAYLLLQAIEYVEARGDGAALARWLPMLRWCAEAQAQQLVEDMMPFNGDETYVAGGLLPRSALNDGSLEATYLFGTSVELLSDLLSRGGHDPVSAATRAAATRALLRLPENFLDADGMVTTNQPRRASSAAPSHRHGACERTHDLPPGHAFFGWTRRDDNGRYTCPACTAAGPLETAPASTWSLISATLLPEYITSRGTIRMGADQLHAATRRFTSGRGMIVGYEGGLLLHALAARADPSAEAVAQALVSLADGTGAWSEYYQDGAPVGARCRPWESAINLSALLLHAGLTESEESRA